DDYISLDHLLSTWGKSPLLTRLRKKTLLTKLGSSIRQLHDAKFAHHALSPEHLFIRFFETENEVPRVDTRIIDLEQGEMKFFFRDSGLNDLKKLLSYANDLSTSELLRFYLSYQRTSKLSKKNKLQILEKILA
ncbi:MAG: hypothetical protein KDD56_10490, partial [Bdellovibrionales bacterium]|nr:hypothetical protein [Bdellovibrionales bacterium]